MLHQLTITLSIAICFGKANAFNTVRLLESVPSLQRHNGQYESWRSDHRFSMVLGSYTAEELKQMKHDETNRNSHIDKSMEKNTRIERKKSDSSSSWDCIDQVYLITCPNADEDSQRLNKAKSILDKVGLLDRVQIKEFDTDDEDRIRGCYTSHISVLRDAINDIDANENVDLGTIEWLQRLLSMKKFPSTDKLSNYMNYETSQQPSYVLVLEDNIELNGMLAPSALESLSEFLDSSDADMVHLSYIPYVPNLIITKTDNNDIVKLNSGIGSALGTTAYIINYTAIQKILNEHSQKGYYAAIPDVMALLFPESRYATYPVPFLRAPTTKSLVNPQLDDLRALLFQPPVVAQVQNLLAWTGKSTNTIFFTLIGALVVSGAVAGKIVIDSLYDILTYGSVEGNILVPGISLLFVLACSLILGTGVVLAPKPPQQIETDEMLNTEIV